MNSELSSQDPGYVQEQNCTLRSILYYLAILIALLSNASTSSADQYLWTTIAGTTGVYGNKDGPGQVALFNAPSGIVSDGKGHLMVGDMFNDSIRQLTRDGTNWTVTTIATNTVRPQGIARDPQGNLYVTGLETNVVWQLHPVGTNYSSEVIFGPFSCPGSIWITVDGQTNMYVTCTFGSFVEAITRTSTNWVATVIADGTVDSAGFTNLDERFVDPEGIARDQVGNLYIGETYSETVREISPVGTNWGVTTIAGSYKNFGLLDGTNGDAQFSAPTGIAIDSSGTLFVTDWGFGSMRKIRHEGTNWVVTTIAGPNDDNFKWPMGVAVDPDGTVYVTDHQRHLIRQGVPFVPTLNCELLGHQVRLSWSQLATNYVLETSTSLSPSANWMSLPETPTNYGSDFQLTYPITAPARFYRLRQ
jgi:sugar lactone lactonase YvrE